MDLAGGDDSGGDTAVAADGVVAAGAEVFLHAGAWMALAGFEQERGTEAEGAVFQGVQVDASDEDVRARSHGLALTPADA